jgi:hypothetical protein
MTTSLDRDIQITTAHLYSVPAWNGRVGFCARGARAWFAQHGFDWSEFVQAGLPASAFEATGDAMALQLVAHARRVELTEDGL